MFLDAWKKDYKRFFDMVFPRLDKGGLFLAHNVVNKRSEMGDFLDAIQKQPVALDDDRVAVGRRDVGVVEAVEVLIFGGRAAARRRRRPSSARASCAPCAPRSPAGTGSSLGSRLRHARQEFLDAVLVELHARVRVLDGNHRSQTVGRFYDPGPNIEPLHHELLRRPNGR